MRIVRLPISHPDALRLVAEVQQEYVIRYGGPDATPLEPAYFDPPAGAFFVGYDAELPVATGAWRRRRDLPGFDEVAEVKRMYVVPAAQRRGLAREMLAHLEQDAAVAGAEAMVLETGAAQPEAIALYESSGYAPIVPFGFYAASPSVRCFAKSLAHLRG